MNLIEDLPEDLIGVLLETLCGISKVSIIVLAYTNTFWYRRVRICAIRYHIDRTLQFCKIASEGLLEVLKWGRLNNCKWDYDTCTNAAKNGHFEVLKWARSNGYPWNSQTCMYAAL